MSHLMEMDTDMFVDLVFKALEKDAEDKLWEKWLVELPHMDKKTFITFDAYKDKHFNHETTTDKTDDEILQDAENILKSMNKPK